MKLSEIIRNSEKPVSIKHERWLTDVDSNIPWSDEALQFAQDVLSGKIGGARSRTTKFRASSINNCSRQQVLKAIGFPSEQKFSSDTKNIFATGNFYHLKWQMMGLTAGWLSKAEVPLENDTYDFGGTADGIVYEGSLLEIKSANDRSFSRIHDTSMIPYGYKLQAHAYMYLSGALRTSFIFENKNNSEWVEHVLPATDNYTEIVIGILDELSEAIATQTLPPVLDDCLVKKGRQYQQCPYKNKCLLMKKKQWPTKEDYPNVD